MAETQSFATKADYEDRYGSGAPERVEVLLQDASALLRSNFIAYHQTAYKVGLNPRFDENACAVTCAIVARAINVPSGLREPLSTVNRLEFISQRLPLLIQQLTSTLLAQSVLDLV